MERISFFWKGVSSCLPTLRGCILQGINIEDDMLFWKDRWLNGRVPMFLWLEELKNSQHPNGIVQDLILLLEEAAFTENGDILLFKDCLRSSKGATGDKKWWMLTGNGAF